MGFNFAQASANFQDKCRDSMSKLILLTNLALIAYRLNWGASRRDTRAHPLYFLFRPESLAL